MNRSVFALLPLLGIVLLSAIGSGCRGVLTTDPMLAVDVPEDRLRRIEPLDMEAMSASEEAEKQDSGKPAQENTDEEQKQPPAELELTLEECRAAALENNLDLEVQLISPAIARETIAEQDARFEPSLFWNSNYRKTETPTATRLEASRTKQFSSDLGVQFPLRTGGTITVDVPFNRYQTNNQFATLPTSYTMDLNASISQPLLRNAGLRTNTHAIRVAHYQTMMSEARTKLELIRVIAALDRVYWRLYAARRELEVRKNQYDLAVAQLERVQRMVEAGQTAEVEIVRARAGVAERLEGIIVADNALRDRERDLKRIMNKPGLGIESRTVIIPKTSPNPADYNLSTARLIDAALKSRMELLELELKIASDASTVDFRRNQTLPAVTLDYTYNINGLGATRSDAYDMLDDAEFSDHYFGLRVAVPIGNEAAQSRLRQAVYSKIQQIATKRRRTQLIKQEVANAADQLDANWQRILASRQRTVLAKRNLDAEERQFKQGLRTSTDVLDAQTRLADAQSAEVQALAEYQIAQVDIAFATGKLLGASGVFWEPEVPAEK